MTAPADRTTRPREIVVEPLGGQRYRVRDPAGSGAWYIVDLSSEPATCECADHQYRHRACKHISGARQYRRPAAIADEAERALLSAVLLEERVPPAVVAAVRAEMFARAAHGVLYGVMCTLTARGSAVDPVTLAAALNGQLDTVGGLESVAALIDVVPTAGHIADYARIVREQWVYRERTRWGAALADPSLSAEQVAATIERLQELQRVLDSTGANGAGLRGYTDREILALPDAEWLVEGLLLLAGLILFVGRWGAGKTFLLIDLVMHIAAGLTWQGRKVRRGPVLYVYAEGAMRLRVAAWRAAHRVADEDTVGVTFVPGAVNLLDTASVAAFVSAVTTERLGPRPVLIVLETLSRMTPAGDENSPETAGLVIAACALIQRETGATVVVSHHTPWAADQQRPRGHTKLPDAADAVFLLENDGGALKLTCQKLRDGEAPAPIHLKLTPQDGALVVDRGEAPPPDSTDVDELLAALGDQALTVDDLEQRLGLSERTVMRRLKDAGDAIEKVSGTGIGRRAATYRVVASRANLLEREIGGAATANGVTPLSGHGSAGSATEREPGE